MYEILCKIIGNDGAKCVGFDVKSLSSGVVGTLSKDMVYGLVSCKMINNVEIDRTGRLMGLGDYRVSSIKTRIDKNVEFCDLDYFEKHNKKSPSVVVGKKQSADSILSVIHKVKEEQKMLNSNIRYGADLIKKQRLAEMLKKEDNTRNTLVLEKPTPTTIATGHRIDGIDNIIELLDVRVSTKTGYGFVVTKTSHDVFEKELKSISMKSKHVDKLSGEDTDDSENINKDVIFSTYLKNWQFKLEDINLDKYQLIVSKQALSSIDRCMKVAKNHKVTGVDMFNIVQPTLYGDLRDFYLFLCKHAIRVED